MDKITEAALLEEMRTGSHRRFNGAAGAALAVLPPAVIDSLALMLSASVDGYCLESGMPATWRERFAEDLKSEVARFRAITERADATRPTTMQ